METSILIAKIIAVIYISFGVGLIFNRNYYKKEILSLLDNSAFMLFGGLYAIVLGLLAIEFHNHWVKDWTVLITIIGWIALLKGVFLLAFPTSFKVFNSMFESDGFFKVLGPLVMLFGLVFAYFGFIN